MCNVAFLTDRKILLNAFEGKEREREKKGAVVSYQIKCDIATTDKFFLPQMWTQRDEEKLFLQLVNCIEVGWSTAEVFNLITIFLLSQKNWIYNEEKLLHQFKVTNIFPDCDKIELRLSSWKNMHVKTLFLPPAWKLYHERVKIKLTLWKEWWMREKRQHVWNYL